jgi:membrane protein implicated in regulation of membrane protease activity
MTWANFYLVCFFVGLLLSVLSLVLGNLHLHLHLPFHLHVGHFSLGTPHAHAPGFGHGGAGQLPAVNFGTITAFLAWFGGIGYLLTQHSHMYTFAALAVAVLGGFAGASIVFVVISRVLMRYESSYEPEDANMVGVLGRLTNSIFENGTGEIVYVQGGTRHSCAARSEDGVPLSKGTEVVVTKYEKGVAYVRTWDELANGEDTVGSENETQ